ncbi:tRNA pseudouridine(38-40) synthase TruA [Aestuariimicrobium soli]|uniref:tRNA pseudouridine(38-40) synthase TruA n=1 Tax=Aestuariimicrobium soli TaxID=2035834 RepID=UPI003EBA3F89
MSTHTTRWRLDLAYDGTNFHGWAHQPGLRTVQGELERWLPQVLRLDAPVALTVAGRTDAGVHADAQVCHLDLPSDTNTSTLLHRLRRVLDGDIAVHRLTPAAPGFDARFSAIWRRYRYRLWDDEAVRTPTLRHRVATTRGRLDPGAMQAAAELTLGLRDFAAFCKPRPDAEQTGATTIRTLQHCEVVRHRDGQIDTVLRADAFCHSMVRSVMGALVAVGLGRRTLSWLEHTLTLDHRATDVTVMPASGLTLEAVGYPDDARLGDRAVESRRRREVDEIRLEDL